MSNLSIEEFANGVKVFQDSDAYKFTKDAIDLAKFCNIKHSDHVLELCAGSGVISFYLYSLCEFNKMYLNEIQPNMCDIITKNIKLNELGDKAICLKGNLKNLTLLDFDKKVDVIICNPPYFKFNGQKINEDYSKAISRHEIETNLVEIIEKSSQLIKDKGKFYMTMTADRCVETIVQLSARNFACKRIKFLTNGKKEAYLVLFEAVFQGKSGVKIYTD